MSELFKHKHKTTTQETVKTHLVFISIMRDDTV